MYCNLLKLFPDFMYQKGLYLRSYEESLNFDNGMK